MAHMFLKPDAHHCLLGLRAALIPGKCGTARGRFSYQCDQRFFENPGMYCCERYLSSSEVQRSLDIKFSNHFIWQPSNGPNG